MSKRSASKADRRLVCGVCKGEIRRGQRYTVRRSSEKNSYSVPLHVDCDSLLSSSVASRAAA